MQKYILGLVLLVWASVPALSQHENHIHGTILENTSEKTPLIGVTLLWLGTESGAITDDNGKFHLDKHLSQDTLLVRLVGYQTDTLVITNQEELTIFLKPSELDEVLVQDKKDISSLTAQSDLLTTKDLRKAACCNLSESFQTNASVDVSTTDAVSGTKRIQMLGLDGVYAQMMREGIPHIRGLNSRVGLHHLPGSWISSIDINKGTGSVVNGYESMTGQINIELVKPELADKLHINLYGNMAGRLEANLNTAQHVSDKWSTATLLHASNLSFTVDQNNDNFLDSPKYTLLTGINRWKYEGENLKFQAGIQVAYEDKISGETQFEKNQTRTETMPYGFGQTVKHLEGWAKMGILSKEKASQSLGIRLSAVRQEQEAMIGLNDYLGTQNTLSANIIFQTAHKEHHLVRTGASYVYEDYTENYQIRHLQHETFDLNRTESVAGLFAEYTWIPNEKLSVVSGIRGDYHNLQGFFLTPRMHLKYEIIPNTVLRLSGGRGLRYANPISENMNYLFSSRLLSIEENLNPEIAWNFGGSLSQQFEIQEKTLTLVADFYRTNFENRIITDLENPDELRIYNLKGTSFANSFQISADYEVFKRFEVSLAYKWYDVQATIGEKLLDLPFVAQNRALLNLAYSSKYEKWSFDFTTQWFGSQRLANTTNNPTEFQLRSQSPHYFLLSGQVTHRFRTWEVYVGGENLGNFRQSNPIIDGQNPFGQNFDASMIYAPIMGRMVYAGLRFTIK